MLLVGRRDYDCSPQGRANVVCQAAVKARLAAGVHSAHCQWSVNAHAPFHVSTALKETLVFGLILPISSRFMGSTHLTAHRHHPDSFLLKRRLTMDSSVSIISFSTGFRDLTFLSRGLRLIQEHAKKEGCLPAVLSVLWQERHGLGKTLLWVSV